MPKYEAYIYKTVNLECKIEVEAPNEEEACDKIETMIGNRSFGNNRFEEVSSDIEFDGFVEEVEDTP